MHPIPRPPSRTTPGFAFSGLERAISECLGRRAFKKPEQEEILRHFGQQTAQCVFCGSPKVERWDHLVPIKDGGETVIGNMVPACAQCDDSKRDVPFDEWMRSNNEFSPKSRGVPGVEGRIAAIQAYVAHYSYQVVDLEQRLTPDELKRLGEIRDDLSGVRKKIESLIADFRKRTGEN
jgi:hypothetical protein